VVKGSEKVREEDVELEWEGGGGMGEERRMDVVVVEGRLGERARGS
jgi:hypothetical protein